MFVHNKVKISELLLSTKVSTLLKGQVPCGHRWSGSYRNLSWGKDDWAQEIKHGSAHVCCAKTALRALHRNKVIHKEKTNKKVERGPWGCYLLLGNRTPLFLYHATPSLCGSSIRMSDSLVTFKSFLDGKKQRHTQLQDYCGRTRSHPTTALLGPLRTCYHVSTSSSWTLFLANLGNCLKPPSLLKRFKSDSHYKNSSALKP